MRCVLLSMAVVALLGSAAEAQRPEAPRESPGGPPAHYPQPRAAAEALTSLGMLDPERAEWRWRLSIALMDLAKVVPDERRAERDSLYAMAVRAAHEAIRLEPDGAQGHFALGAALGRASLTRGSRDRVRDAATIRTALLRALELDPSHDGAWHALGRWHAEIMRLSGLSRFMARTILGGAVLGEASWDRAMRALEQAVSLRPDWIYHHLHLAEVLIDAGRAAEAIPHLEAITRLPSIDVLDARYRSTAADLLRGLGSPKGP